MGAFPELLYGSMEGLCFESGILSGTTLHNIATGLPIQVLFSINLEGKQSLLGEVHVYQ